MTRMTTTQAVADRNRRVASELPRIKVSFRPAPPRTAGRMPDVGFGTGSCSNQSKSPAPDQCQSSAGRRRGQQIAKAPHGLDDVDLELLADAADENFDRIGVAIEILIVEMLDQFRAR